jgi:hypothetical protein
MHKSISYDQGSWPTSRSGEKISKEYLKTLIHSLFGKSGDHNSTPVPTIEDLYNLLKKTPNRLQEIFSKDKNLEKYLLSIKLSRLLQQKTSI